MKNIIITGASGLVATELVFKLLRNTDANLYLLSTHVDKIAQRYKDYPQRVNCYTLEEFQSYAPTAKVKYDICIHAAFSRNAKGSLIADSIEYQRALIALLKKLEIGIFANISSQSVYGKSTEPLWKENAPLDPDYLYAMGKCFSEVVTKIMLEDSGIRWTNLRLCSVCENARFMRVFVQNAIEGKPIILTAPEQQCSFIEVQDVADALMAFIEKSDKVKLEPAYNLGANLVDTIKGIAFRVKRIGEEQYGLNNVVIVEKSSDCNIRIGMDASVFMDTFGWLPRHNMDDMVIEMFEMLKNVNGGGYPISFKIVYGLWTQGA